LGRAPNIKAEQIVLHHRLLLAAIGDRESYMLSPHQGASAMSTYRAYLIARNGHHIKAVDLECVDDDAAKKRAEQMADGTNVSCGSTPAELRGLTANLNE
jgi:hypothetical protein